MFYEAWKHSALPRSQLAELKKLTTPPKIVHNQHVPEETWWQCVDLALFFYRPPVCERGVTQRAAGVKRYV